MKFLAVNDRNCNNKIEDRTARIRRGADLKIRMADYNIRSFAALARRIRRRRESIFGYLNNPVRFPHVHRRIERLLKPKPQNTTVTNA